MRPGLAIIFVLYFLSANAQKFTVSGYVKDASSGEVLIDCTVYVPALHSGATTNSYGFFSLTLPADSQTLIFSYIGYKPQIKKLKLTADIRVNINLNPENYQLNEVIITTKKARENVNRPVMGVIDVPIQQVKELPAFMGEKDLFKVLQLLPGVQSGSEASAGFYVRGGGPDQNLILLDEAVIYNPYHLAGFFSTFNADAIKTVSLVKGGYPAQYGGRLSSIVDIAMKDGNDKSFHGEGGIGAISSRLLLEGPIIKNKASFMISGRRTYLDAIIRPFLPSGITAAYYFYDLNGKVNYKFSDKDRVYLSSYFGKDVFFTGEITKYDTSRFDVNWGNKSATARWNHLFSDKLFSNTTLIYNDYIFSTQARENSLRVKLLSGVRDIGGKVDFDWYPNVRNKVKFGAQYTYQKFIPSSVKGQTDFLEFLNQQVKYVHQGAMYVNDEIDISDPLSVNIGIRAPAFVYKKTRYYSLEPRFTAKYSLSHQSSIKASYTWMNQYIHLISNSSLSTPLDLWIPSSDLIKPQRAQQGSIGYFRNFLSDKYESSVEVYYKDMRNMIEYKEGAEIFLNPNIDKELVFGRGWSYGAEFFLRKNEGRLTGWIGYTLAYANRLFPDLNNGKPYPAKYDRRHDLSLTGVYNFNKKWSFSAVFVYGSGHSLTLPYGTFYVPVTYPWGTDFVNAYDYLSKNGFKLMPYNRLDIGIKYIVQHKKWESDWRFDIYNVYSRRNPYFVYLTTEQDPNSNARLPVAKQVSLFPIIPTFSYNFKF